MPKSITRSSTDTHATKNGHGLTPRTYSLQSRLTFSPRQQLQQLPLPLRRHHRPPRRERIVSASFARRSAWSKTLLRYSAELPVGSIVSFCWLDVSTKDRLRSAVDWWGQLRSLMGFFITTPPTTTHLWREASFGSGGQADFFVSVQFSTITHFFLFQRLGIFWPVA